VKSEERRPCFTEGGGVTDEKMLSFTENIIGASKITAAQKRNRKVQKTTRRPEDDGCERALSFTQK